MIRRMNGRTRLRAVLLLAACAVLLVMLASVVWERSTSDGEATIMAEDAYFSGDYRTARDRFRQAVAESGGRLEALALTATDPGGEPLTIEVGWFGPAQPRRALLHVSGIHGVEAFAGSAIQLRLIEALPAVPSDTAIVFVHVLNPYGMAWLRRFNENNVDLNRNFLPVGETYAGRPEGYDGVNEFLNPSRLPTPDWFVVRAAWLILRHGRSALEAAVVSGQYDYPEGLFFGGNELQEGVQLYTEFLARNLSAADAVFAIDVHTGLGPFGEDTVLVSEDQYTRMRSLLGDRVQAFSSSEENVAYEIRGGHHEGVVDMLDGVNVDFVGQEFGTYSQIHVLGALRMENYAHHHSDADLDDPLKTDLKDAFYPRDPEWEERVLTRGSELFTQGLAILDGQ